MVVIWIAVALGAQTEQSSIVGLEKLISFPELLRSFLHPWLLSLPLMTVILIAGVGLALAGSLFVREYDNPGLRLLLAIVIVSVIVIGGAQTMYIETRYSFHVYPLLVLLTLFGFAHSVIGGAPIKEVVERWAPLVFLCLFVISSDFALGHMAHIDTYDANFRVGYDDRRAKHYYQRFDFKSPADFVNKHADPSDLVITTSVVVTQYLEMNSFVYLHETDRRYRGQACDFGKMERWTGLPLVDNVGDIEALAESKPGSSLWLIVDQQTLKRTLPHEYLTGKAGYEQVFVSPDERLTVYLRSMREQSAP